MTMKTCCVVAMLFALLCVPTANAQTAGTGALTGTVTDSAGAAIPAATVTVTSVGTGQSRIATTGENGSYRVNLLPPGAYKVKFEAPGMAAVEVPSVQIDVTETPVLDRSLNIATEKQTITVEATAEIIQTASSALGSVVGSATVAELPLSTRNYVNLIAMAAGTNADVNNATGLGKGWIFTNVNGANNTQNNYQMDGAPIDNWASFNVGNDSGFFASLPVPNPDAIQEFKIQTSSYDAGYGRNAGANVNVITKSGTDRFHGSAFEFFRNTALNANEWFFQRAEFSQGLPNKRPVLNQNQFGGTIGGPIKKDKLFFFASYQETRQINGISLYGFSGVFLPPIPGGSRGACPKGWSTATQCDATAQNFIRNLGAANCGGAGTLRGGVQVACDGSTINPVSVNLLQLKLPNGNYYVPSPSTLPGVGGSALSNYSDPAHYKEHQLIANGDYLINAKHTLSTRYVYSADPTTAPFSCAIQNGTTTASCLPGAPVTFSYPDHAAVLKLTSVLSNNLVNEARVSFQRFTSDTHNLVPFTNSQVGITGLTPQIDQLTYLSITNQFVIGANPIFGVSLRENQYQFADQVSWTHGKHSFRMGAEVPHNSLTTYLPSIELGQPTFATFADFLVGRGSCAAFTGTGACSPANAGTTNGTSFSNVSAIGNNLSARAFDGQLQQTFKANEINAFFQDDWKITSRLTLNLGVRWEYGGFPKADGGGWSDVWPSLIAKQPIPGNSPATGTLAGYVVPSNFQGPIPTGVVQSGNDYLERVGPSWKDFGPRAGFAWQPFGTKRFVLRGGGGVFYDRINGHTLALDGIVTPPYGVTPALSPSASLANPFPLPPTVAGPTGTPGWPARWVNFTTNASSNLSGRGIAETLPVPTVYEWNINTQTEFLPKWVLELGYVGSRGIHLSSYLPVAGATSGGNAPPINLAQLASPTSPVNCGYDGVPTDCVTTSTTANIPTRVPYLGFSTGFAPVADAGQYKFNSLQVTVRSQLSHGLQFQAAYTWSSAEVNYWVGNSAATQPGINPIINAYGPNTQYRPQRLVVNYNWALPFGKHTGLLGVLTSDWNWSGVVVIQSGDNLLITDSRDGSIFSNGGGPIALATFCPGEGNANVLASGSLTSRVTSGLTGGPGYFNKTGVFCAPQAVSGGTGYGSAGLGGLRGPGQDNWDMSLAKRFKTYESQFVEVRTEFFNAFNHPQFGNPAANVALGSFGQIGATSVNPRLIQFALKYVF
jgi:Carboxypeptidase regulatory-like domain